MSAATDVPAVETRVREIFRRLFEDRDLSDPGRYWTAHADWRMLPLDLHLVGPESIAGFFADLFAAVPDWRLEVEQVITQDRDATIRWRGTGTFTGAPWQGIAATGSAIEVRGVDVMRLDAGGVVERNVVYYDGAEFARQIGMLPRRGSAADRAVLAAFNAVTRLRRRGRG